MKIEKYKKYPKRAKRLKQQGRVVISFEVMKNGQIRNITVKSKSPYKRLNEAAKNILKNIKSFDPIPKQLNRQTWAIEVPLSYLIQNT